MEKLLIVDGSGLLFQSFYGMPNQIKNSSGMRVEAVICFLGILFKQLKAINPNKLFIVFDGETHLSRKDENPDYKANRLNFADMPAEDTPFNQLEIIKNVLTKLNFQWHETQFLEADDIIASITNDYKNNYDIIISSADKDFFQLITNNVYVYTYRGKASTLYTPQAIKTKYGFSPQLFASYKCLCGDSSDNIKGIHGIGHKTATKLLVEYGDVFNIIDQAKIKTDKLSLNVVANQQKLLINYKIIELFSKRGLYKLADCKFIMPNESCVNILKQLNIL